VRGERLFRSCCGRWSGSRPRASPLLFPQKVKGEIKQNKRKDKMEARTLWAAATEALEEVVTGEVI
jgi:hypothetical protein